MQRLLLLFVFVLPFAAVGQITITSSDMPQAGQNYLVSASGVPAGDLDADTGPNFTWDFSTLVPNDQRDISYVSGLGSPYGINFFLLGNKFGTPAESIPQELLDALADLLSGLGVDVSIGNEYVFYDNNTSSVLNASARGISIGVFGLPLPVSFSYDDPDRQFEFPLDFGDTALDDFDYGFEIPTITELNFSGQRSTVVDGWGKVILPIDTFDCLRITSTLNTTIELDISFLTSLIPLPIPIPLPDTVGIPVTTKEYYWYAKGEGIPVAKATGIDLSGLLSFIPPPFDALIGGLIPPEFLFVAPTFEYKDAPITPPVADFTATPVAGCAPLTVAFTNTSSGDANYPNTYSWDFGDGNTSDQANPTHTYTEPGTYTVTLTANGPVDSDENQQVDLVVVNAPAVAFSGTPTTVNPGDTVFFTDQTPGSIVSWSWDYGDGGSDSTANPTHVYNLPGSYTVALTVTDIDGCSATLSQPTYITVNDTTSNRFEILPMVQQLSLYPNPSHAGVAITGTLNRGGDLHLTVLDAVGRVVDQKLFQAAGSGRFNFQWNRPKQLATGVYTFRLVVEGYTLHRKVVLE